MNIQMAVLCDAAADYGGKLNILGTFDTIYSSQFPAVHPHCAVALRITFEKSEEGRHPMKLSFGDEDGKPIVPPIDLPVDVVVPGDATFVSRNFVLNIQGMKFDRPGLYSVNLVLNGRHEASIPLAVKPVPKGPTKAEL